MEFTQVCHVVRDLNATIDRWARTTGAGPFFTLDSILIPQRLYRGAEATDRFMAAVGFLGTTQYEFVQPLNDEPSIYREILTTRGEAVHHVQPRQRVLKPGEYDELCKHYRSLGFEVAAEVFVPGIGRAHFFDAINEFGFFFETVEIGEEFFKMIEAMYAAHLSWDGKRPARDLSEITASFAGK